MDENLQDDAAIITADEVDTQEGQESGFEDTTEQVSEEVVSKKQFNQVLARAKRAEEELKKSKTSVNPATSQQINNNNPELSEELKLIARGLSDEEINQAKVIAKGKGIVLTEAIKDPMFLTIQKDIKEKEKRENAKLGASRGSGESQDDTLIKPVMTRDEHMAAFKKAMGK